MDGDEDDAEGDDLVVPTLSLPSSSLHYPIPLTGELVRETEDMLGVKEKAKLAGELGADCPSRSSDICGVEGTEGDADAYHSLTSRLSPAHPPRCLRPRRYQTVERMQRRAGTWW
jgi:hypothetical protein